MKKVIFSIMALAISFAIYSCKDTNGPDNTATVTLRSELQNSTAKLATVKLTDGTTKVGIDSIQVKRIRILLTEVKFHSAKEGDDSKDNLYKSGPLLYDVDSTGTKIEIASGTLPSGNYSQLKFEIHRFETSELSEFTNSALFKDFATSDRFSVIIDGIFYLGGNGTRFQYKGTPTINYICDFGKTPINLPGNQESVFYLTLDPNSFFRSDVEIFDPSSNSNSQIDNLIKSAIRISK
jgi:hypothetical protein